VQGQKGSSSGWLFQRQLVGEREETSLRGELTASLGKKDEGPELLPTSLYKISEGRIEEPGLAQNG